MQLLTYPIMQRVRMYGPFDGSPNRPAEGSKVMPYGGAEGVSGGPHLNAPLQELRNSHNILVQNAKPN